MTKIVVVGFNGAGLATVKALKKHLKNNIEIIVIEKQKDLFYNIAAPRAVVDDVFAEKCFISLDSFFTTENEGKIIHGTVKSFTGKQVVLEDGSAIPFDYLIIASGAMYDLPWKIQDPTKATGLAILKDTSAKIKASSKVVIIGGGATGIETATEIKSTCKFSLTVDPDKEVTLIQHGKLLAKVVCPDKHRTRLHKKLDAMGIKVIIDKVAELPKDVIKTGSHQIKTSSSVTIDSDLTLQTTGKIKPNSSFVDESLLTQDKFIKVKPTLQLDSNDFANVFSLGDVANTGSSKTVIYLDSQATIVAQNIASLMAGSNNLKNFTPTETKLSFLALGSKDGLGILPWTPGFASDFMAKSFKAGDMFVGKAMGEYKVKQN